MEELENYLIRNNWVRICRNTYWLALKNSNYIEVILNKEDSTATRNAFDRHYKKIVSGEAWDSAFMHRALVSFMENYNRHYIQAIQKNPLPQPALSPDIQPGLIETLVQLSRAS